METVDLKKLVGVQEGAFCSGVAADSGEMTVLVWLLGARACLPELKFTRSEVVYMVLEGSLSVLIEKHHHQVDSGQLLAVSRQKAHQPRNNGDRPARIVVMRTPGPLKLEDVTLGRVDCPVCAAGIPVEKGDRVGDHFVCSDCGFVITLEEHEGLLRPAGLTTNCDDE